MLLLDSQNGSFRGFGFADGNAAFEMKKQIQEAIKPYDIQDYVDGVRSIIRETQVNNELIQASIPDQKVHANASSTAVTSYGTLQKSSSSRQGSTEFMQGKQRKIILRKYRKICFALSIEAFLVFGLQNNRHHHQQPSKEKQNRTHPISSGDSSSGEIYPDSRLGRV